MRQVIVSCFLAILLSGCATVSDPPLRYGLGNGSEGLAVVSLTLSGKDLANVSSFEYEVRDAPGQYAGEVRRRSYFASARQHARWLQDKQAQGPTDNRMRVIVKGSAVDEPLDIVESGRDVGRLATIPLPAGDYELYDWKVVVPNGYGRNEFTPRQDFSYRFRVDAGHATYLGNLNLHVTEQDRYDITVANKATRDMALLMRKVPTLRGEQIIHRVGQIQQ